MRKNPKIIGTFRGKCCDANIYNNNGMLLDRELFNVLINSEDYKRAMKNRYYIGFLGHPEDPNCMDFEHACIIMTDMEMLENGDIWGTFDLVDTPVGRIVKAFIDAGVTFGISIRGAGDLDASGRVDPETFVFRGYDLVTFPAYDDAVPEFQEIAASSDIQKQSKYKKVCAAIQTNLNGIQSCEALEIIQSQFNENSNEYATIGNRIEEVKNEECENCSMLQQKLDAMTNLYIQLNQDCQKLFDENNALKLQLSRVTADSERKIHSLKRITSSQEAQLEKALKSAENKYLTVISANSRLKDQNQQYVTACEDLQARLDTAQKEMKSLRRQNKELDNLSSSIQASSSEDIHNLKAELRDTKSKLKEVQSANLIYERKIESINQMIAERDETISGLKSELRETVTANKKLDQESLNRDEETEALNQEILSCRQLIEDYQQAYADMCANAIGVTVDNIPITNSTSPLELKKYIFGSTSTSGMPSRPTYAPLEQIEALETDYDDYNDNGLTTL